MRAICLVDTSIFVEILNVPCKATQSEHIIGMLEEKVKAAESLFLPMATILETGNHIAQNGDGNMRRQCAARFVMQVQQALTGQSPFSPVNFLTSEALLEWIADFPDSAMQGCGFGDLSIIQDWQRLCGLNTGRRVYIWSLDHHLHQYDQPARI